MIDAKPDIAPWVFVEMARTGDVAFASGHWKDAGRCPHLTASSTGDADVKAGLGDRGPFMARLFADCERSC